MQTVSGRCSTAHTEQQRTERQSTCSQTSTHMGQYFQIRNVSKREYFQLDGFGTKFGAAVMQPFNGMRLTYLLYEGPLDGTSIPYSFDPDDPLARSHIDTLKANELARERAYMCDAEKYESFVDKGFERDEPPLQYAAERMVHFGSSVYRDDNGEWNEKQMIGSAMAGLSINDALSYAGRWAGDDIRLVGDYAEGNLYMAPRGTHRYSNDETGDVIIKNYRKNRVIEYTKRGPGAISVTESEDVAEVGEQVIINQEPYTYTGPEVASEWTDITDGMEAEMQDCFGTDWLNRLDGLPDRFDTADADDNWATAND